MHRCLICYRLKLETSQGPLTGDEIKRYAKPRKPDIKEYNLVIYDSIYMKFNSKQSLLTHDDRKQKGGSLWRQELDHKESNSREHFRLG